MYLQPAAQVDRQLPDAHTVLGLVAVMHTLTSCYSAVSSHRVLVSNLIEEAERLLTTSLHEFTTLSQVTCSFTSIHTQPHMLQLDVKVTYCQTHTYWDFQYCQVYAVR